MTAAEHSKLVPCCRIDSLACGFLSLIWLIPIFIIGLEGNFPLNDDWAYALATRRYLETGSYHRSLITYAPIFTNIGIGTFASYLAGFSFETLRVSTIILGWGGILASYALGRCIGVPVFPSFVLASLIAVNPIYLNLSYTFMTDVPFVAMISASLAFFARWASNEKIISLVAGTVFAVAALLSRQPALAVPLALGFVVSIELLRKTLLSKVSIIAAIAAIVFMVGVYTGSSDLFGTIDSGDTFTMDDAMRSFISSDVTYQLVFNSLTALTYLGLFFLPLSVLCLGSDFQFKRRMLLGTLLLALAGLAILELRYVRMPIGINIIQDYGLGPQHLFGTVHKPSEVPRVFWLGMTGLGLWGGLFLAGSTLSVLWKRRSLILGRPDILVYVFFVVIYISPFLPRAPYFDRYLLPVIAPLGALLLVLLPPGKSPSTAIRTAVVICVSLISVWSVTGTRDYLEHHRARWRLLAPLIEQGVHPSRIDGGYEFTGWYNSESLSRSWRPDIDRGSRWIESEEYVLSYMSVVDGYEPIADVSYRRLFSGAYETLTLHQRRN